MKLNDQYNALEIKCEQKGNVNNFDTVTWQLEHV